MASLFKVKALYDFEAAQDDDLGFSSGQIIDITEEVDENWLEGKYNDSTGAERSGIFPREFVEKYEPPMPVRPVRPTRAKQEATPAPAPTPIAAPAELDPPAPTIPTASKPQVAPAEVPAPSREEVASPPPAPKPTPAEPMTSAAKKAPPPVASKSNAFKDRIAAFNQPAAAPIVPMIPGGARSQPTFIKKPFVAPPPSSNAYVPPPKAEPVYKTYVRAEDPEIQQRQEEDRAAAENAGLLNDTTDQAEEDGEPVPKPQSLKERIALLQKQQLEQAQRRAEPSAPKERKAAPVKRPTDPSEPDLDAEDDEREQARSSARKSMDRERPRVPGRQAEQPALPSHLEQEILSDGNEADQSAAGETTEDDADTIAPEDGEDRQAPLSRQGTGNLQHEVAAAEADVEAEGEEEDEVDEETRRRLELRERMAKMSGGMGMAGMFGPPGGMAMPGIASKKPAARPKQTAEDDVPSAAPAPPQQRVPIFPGASLQSPETVSASVPSVPREQSTASDNEEDDVPEQPAPVPPRRSLTVEERGAPPPIPKDSRPMRERSVPPPPPPQTVRSHEGRAVPPPPPPHTDGPLSPGPGSESDDELSTTQLASAEQSGADTPGPLPMRTPSGASGIPPPVPGSRALPPRPPQSPPDKRSSYFGTDAGTSASSKRLSRAPPPVPAGPAMSPRPAPPPPPESMPPSRRPTELPTADGDEEGESEYEGDYDTDIASSAKHKDALKSHARESSLDDSTTADDASIASPVQQQQHHAPRAVPPVPPMQPPAKSRPSTDTPRGPPPMPPPRDTADGEDDDDYDPYRYDSRNRPAPPAIPGAVALGAPPPPPPHAQQSRDIEEEEEEEEEEDTPVLQPRTSIDRAPPPPPPGAPARTSTRQSFDIRRSDTTSNRRSMEAGRPSAEFGGQIATDLDLSHSTQWWTAPQPLPPVLQSRKGVDILSECEESTSSKRGGRMTVSKDIYVLYPDYSQTIITARYDSANPADVQLEQDHKPPPARLRQDELEQFSQRFGRAIADAAASLAHNSKKDSVSIGDGSPAALPAHLIATSAGSDALLPVGTRAYGVAIYVNLANASTAQHDEIRPGDIVTLRNARFEGHHGAMNKKYRVEYGPQHVAVVEEWDGTKRAIRAWEQGREKKGGVRSEKFRLGDLRSGEVKVWRVVGREWVEWGA